MSQLDDSFDGGGELPAVEHMYRDWFLDYEALTATVPI